MHFLSFEHSELERKISLVAFVHMHCVYAYAVRMGCLASS